MSASREVALRLATEWVAKFVAPSQNYPAKNVVDIAEEFLVFLDGNKVLPQADLIPNRDVNRNPNSKRDNRTGA